MQNVGLNIFQQTYCARRHVYCIFGGKFLARTANKILNLVLLGNFYHGQNVILFGVSRNLNLRDIAFFNFSQNLPFAYNYV